MIECNKVGLYMGKIRGEYKNDKNDKKQEFINRPYRLNVIDGSWWISLSRF